MPRTARASVGNVVYHVINRGNSRGEVFHKPEDYTAFVGLMGEACERSGAAGASEAARRAAVRVLGYCLMPNHFHLVLWPRKAGGLSAWMQWLLTSHVRRYHRHYGGSGHVWQGRFKAFPVQSNEHYLKVLRYVERNPLRGKLEAEPGEWQWSSARTHLGLPELQEAAGGGAASGRAVSSNPLGGRALSGNPARWLADGPVLIPRNWRALLAGDERETELAVIRGCVQRGTPLGADDWVKRTAKRLGLQSTLNPRGRPRKGVKK